MRHYLIILILLELFTLGCNQTHNNDLLDKDFIESYEMINPECTDVLRRLLKPYDFASDSLEIKEIYKLEIDFDTLMYQREVLENMIFLGLVYNSDMFDIGIIGLNPSFGMINTCHPLDSNKTLIINNTIALVRDMSILVDVGCFDLDTSDIYEVGKSDGQFYKIIRSTRLYGSWAPITNDTYNFVNNIYNNYWDLGRKNEMIIRDLKSDTIKSFDYEIDGEWFINKTLLDTFEILTLTKSALVLRNLDNKKIHILEKRNKL